MAGKDSLGFVETIGLVTAVEVADAMSKAASVSIRMVANADAGLISVVCEGDLASCMAAVDAGKAAGGALGQVVATNLIARPDNSLDGYLSQQVPCIVERRSTAPSKTGKEKSKKNE
ncbi:ethanolamine utilization protein EutK [Desulfacinum hydrothermale DSM 13146]|uniref:Ethanolamine utilization protein EutK n=1 Tax=Desulfacinum hydrothermale DSM 13146 TaxID=1121390 RepID=A0A1W1XDU1_9BACT|nr:BMC domain-containing protein [Desulfacinum hydrothermale]SMC22040.1 ethanolamine utilization protein EutK [Desulfacinum hydrothermale DSM 13146]